MGNIRLIIYKNFNRRHFKTVLETPSVNVVDIIHAIDLSTLSICGMIEHYKYYKMASFVSAKIISNIMLLIFYDLLRAPTFCYYKMFGIVQIAC